MLKKYLYIIILSSFFLNCKHPPKTAFYLNHCKSGLFKNSSGIKSIEINQDKIYELKELGMLWGFLKYYHPKVCSGLYNWDGVLFLAINKIIKTKSSAESSKVMEDLVDELGEISICKSCNDLNSSNIKLQPNYSDLFTNYIFSSSLKTKIIAIKNNFQQPDNSYYISLADYTRNPVFSNELTYSESSFPDAGLSLLALFRYWNDIQYFYPYRYLINDWDKTLLQFIPVFAKLKNRDEYAIACLKLIARIQDSHANTYNSPTLDTLKGLLICPIKTRFYRWQVSCCRLLLRPKGCNE